MPASHSEAQWSFDLSVAQLRQLGEVADWANTELRGTSIRAPLTAEYINTCVANADTAEIPDDEVRTLRFTDHSYRAIGSWLTRHRTDYGAASDRYNDLRTLLKMPTH